MLGSLPPVRFLTRSLTAGIRVEPPTITTSSPVGGCEPAQTMRPSWASPLTTTLDSSSSEIDSDPDSHRTRERPEVMVPCMVN